MVALGGAILVDTHFILWQRTKPHLLTQAERDILDDATIRYLSIVSVWEIAMLQGLGRVPAEPRLLEVPSGFDLLPVQLTHCNAYGWLPLHHRDPFDRMLVAQTRSESLTLMTRDRAMQAYRQYVTILP